MKIKEVSENVGLKQLKKTKIMAFAPIISWQIEGEKVEEITDFTFLGSKITAGGDCSHKINTLGPWKENYDKPRQYTKTQRHYFSDKGPYQFSSAHFSCSVMSDSL